MTAHKHHSGSLTCSGSVRETLLVPVMAHGHIIGIFTVLKTKINKKDKSVSCVVICLLTEFRCPFVLRWCSVISVIRFLQNRLSACYKPRLCSTSPSPTINANGPLDEYWYQTFRGVGRIYAAYCISQNTQEHQDGDPQGLEDKLGGLP